MLTLNTLKEWGADTDTGLKRCMNNEAFYLRLVGTAVRDASFAQLREAVEAGDLDRGFELAHALKGTTANLALEPIREPVSEITELLRSRTAADYSALLDRITAARDALAGLL